MKRFFLFSVILFGYSTCFSQENITINGRPCPMTGDAKSEKIKKLDILKNRYRIPSPGDFDRSVDLRALLKPGLDQERFSESKAVRIRGYVVEVKPGGKETCNCHGLGDDRDTHIAISLDPAHGDETERLIVEVSPRIRRIMADKGIDWSTERLKQKFEGKYVEIEGWLFYDKEHRKQSENMNPGNPRNWRRTSWEIHPVTSIKILR